MNKKSRKVTLKRIISRIFALFFVVSILIFTGWFGACHVALSQDESLHTQKIIEKQNIEDMLLFFNKREYKAPYLYDLDIKTKYYWVRYNILGVMPFDVLYDTNDRKLVTVARYE
ncbi:MAG: hypothetical protein K8R54_14860 [Bacteroidales bacterium]|nr:hypothetical protein [Bacteroidales bacterium]